MGVSGVCIQDNCVSLRQYAENLVSSPNSTVSTDFVNKVFARTMAGAAMAGSGMLLDLMVGLALWTYIMAMQPLSLSDPSLVRIRLGATLMMIGGEI